MLLMLEDSACLYMADILMKVIYHKAGSDRGERQQTHPNADGDGS